MNRFLAAALIAIALPACGSSAASTSSNVPVPDVKRPGFLGAFFRPQDHPPFGVFSVYSKQTAPLPYPQSSTVLFGPQGYCDRVAANGVSISSGYQVDAAKLADIVELGVRWTRTPPSQFFDDRSHFDTLQPYAWADLDSAECALARHRIEPVLTLEAGPVQYNAIPGQFSPAQVPLYKTPADFGTWCGVVTAHERRIFTNVHRYSEPGNEVNGNTELFPGGEAQTAAYATACYRAIKAADPKAFVYGFELNMDRHADPTGFVKRMYDLGCKPGTCYDGISLHLSLRYPIPPPGTPCYPNPGGDYSMQCIADLQTAAHARVHVLIGETGYFVPGSVPDEATKAKAIVAAFRTFAANRYVDGVNYANVDECDLYASGYFVGGCLVDSLGKKLPGYDALKALAAKDY